MEEKKKIIDISLFEVFIKWKFSYKSTPFVF